MSHWKQAAVAGVAGVILDGLFRTLRYDIEGAHHFEQFTRQGEPVIFALWHGRLMPLAYLHRGQGVVTLISASADGDYLTRLMAHWGFTSVRGSSSRGGQKALRALVQQARSGRSLAITPDGPRGPMQQLKPGVLVAAQLSGVPIIPTTATARSGWWPGRWDRFLIPRPFTTVRVRYAAPVFVLRNAEQQQLADQASELEQQLNRMTAELDASVKASQS